jgi:pimeloyl-ACP methyl ester carboxylesterase
MTSVPAFIERRPEQGVDATRAPIVFLHGIGGGKAQWTAQLDALAAGGWRTLAWDMPGYGDSALPGGLYRFDALAVSLGRMLDASSIDQAIVTGHSMGGMVALEACAQFPDRIGGLVLSCTSAAFGSADGRFQQQFLDDRLEPLDAGLGMAAVAAQQIPRMMSASAPQLARDQAMNIMSAVPEATYRAALSCLVTFDRRDVLGTIHVPTLVLAAADDPLSPPRAMERMAARIDGAEFEVLSGCGHLANLERPVAFSAAVLDFVDRRCRR